MYPEPICFCKYEYICSKCRYFKPVRFPVEFVSKLNKFLKIKL